MSQAFISTLPTKGQSLAPLPLLSRLVLRAAMAVVAWEARLRTRATLRNLSAHQLADIGLDAQEASTEADKPFWRA